jgi:hypothetical protein
MSVARGASVAYTDHISTTQEDQMTNTVTFTIKELANLLHMVDDVDHVAIMYGQSVTMTADDFFAMLRDAGYDRIGAISEYATFANIDIDDWADDISMYEADAEELAHLNVMFNNDIPPTILADDWST